MRSDIQPGATFPDYELPDHTGRLRRLSDLQQNDPMILVLSRGHCCPKERRQLARLVEFYPDLKVGYTRLVTISTDSLLETNEFRDGLGAQWPFLSDPERRVQRDLDIQEYTDAQHDPMIPHTLVLEPGLKVFKIYEGYWYWGRPSIDDLWRDLREVTRRIDQTGACWPRICGAHGTGRIEVASGRTAGRCATYLQMNSDDSNILTLAAGTRHEASRRFRARERIL